MLLIALNQPLNEPLTQCTSSIICFDFVSKFVVRIRGRNVGIVVSSCWHAVH